MKLITTLVILAILGFTVYYDQIVEPKPTPIESNIKSLNLDQVPNIKMTDLNGKEISFYELDEEIILVNFWASWCAPCIKEMPDLVTLIEKNAGQIALVTISIDYHENRITDFIKPFQDVQNIYWIWDKDKNISLNVFNTMNIPETIIIDKDRKMVKKIVGAINWQEQTINSLTN